MHFSCNSTKALGIIDSKTQPYTLRVHDTLCNTFLHLV